jgi:hypothetical protein
MGGVLTLMLQKYGKKKCGVDVNGYLSSALSICGCYGVWKLLIKKNQKSQVH